MREGDRGDRVFVSVLKTFEKVLKSETNTQCSFCSGRAERADRTDRHDWIGTGTKLLNYGR